LNGVQKTNGWFQFNFTNNIGALFGVQATSNLSLPSDNWTNLGGILEISPGQFQFADALGTNAPRKFYRFISP
jgi:hypothetical protein